MLSALWTTRCCVHAQAICYFISYCQCRTRRATVHEHVMQKHLATRDVAASNIAEADRGKMGQGLNGNEYENTLGAYFTTLGMNLVCYDLHTWIISY